MNERELPLYRAEQIAQKMSAFDIIGLNETFDEKPCELIHSHFRELWGDDCSTLYGPIPDDGRFNGGLTLISRFPFATTNSMIFRNFSSPAQYGLGADGFAAKGVLHARLSIPSEGRSGTAGLDVFVTHLEARDGAIRRKQFNELGRFLGKHTSEETGFILLGDLNTRGNAPNRTTPTSMYNQLFDVLKRAVPKHRVIDTWLALNPEQDGGTKRQTGPTGGPRIDYIIIGQPKQGVAVLEAVQIAVNPCRDDRVVALSDHSAVEATLRWR